MIPSFSRKAVSGQNNYLGMVTSHKMIENEMGYRGSKSKMVQATQSPSPVFVKEQRADGSYLGLIPRLRCALTGCESSYPIKYHSKQINKKPFSTLSKTSHLNPWFITGFSDAESCFSILIQANIQKIIS